MQPFTQYLSNIKLPQSTPFLNHQFCIQCGERVFLIDHGLLKEDFSRFKELFSNKGNNVSAKLDPNLKIGWELLFAILEGSPIKEKLNDEELRQLFSCVFISGSNKGASYLAEECKFLLDNDLKKFIPFLESYIGIFSNESQNTKLKFFFKEIFYKVISKLLDSYFKDPIDQKQLLDYILRYGPSVLKVSIYSAKKNFIKHFPNLFPNAREVYFERNIQGNKVKKFADSFKDLKNLEKINLGTDAPFSLSFFEHPGLSHLKIRAMDSLVSPLNNPISFSRLKTLSIIKGNLELKTLPSIIALTDLQNLNLNGCQIDIEEFQILYLAKHLVKLNLGDANIKGSNPSNITSFQTWKLKQSLPDTIIKISVPYDPIYDQYTSVNYDQVLTENPLPFSISLNQTLTYEEINTGFTNLGKKIPCFDGFIGDKYRSFNFENIIPYDHALLPLPFYSNGSPIKCPDPKVRIAASFPSNSDCRTRFWWTIIHSGCSLILYLRNMNKELYMPAPFSRSYFPEKAASMNIKIEGKDFNIENKGSISSFGNMKLTKLNISSGITFKTVYQIEFPAETLNFENLWELSHIMYGMESQVPGPTLVHSIDENLTGQFFSCYCLYQLLDQANLKYKPIYNLYFNFPELIKNIAIQRMGLIHVNQIETLLKFYQSFPTQIFKKIHLDHIVNELKRLDGHNF